MGDPFNILLQRRGVLTSRNSTFLNSFLCVQKPSHCQSNVSFLPFSWATIAAKQPVAKILNKKAAGCSAETGWPQCSHPHGSAEEVSLPRTAAPE